MSVHFDNNQFPYYESLDEAKSDGYFPIHVRTVLEFFTLAGRKSVISKENLTPIPDLKYVVLDGQNKYYVKELREYSVDDMYFYGRDNPLFLEDFAIENIKRYINDRRLWVLYTEEQVTQASEMFARVYKFHLNGEGKLGYRMFYKIAEEVVLLADYKETRKSDDNFKTTCKLMQNHIDELWKKSYKQ